MRLAALTTGVGAPAGAFQGSVAAVYPHACIVVLQGGALLTLAVRAVGSLPCAITLDVPPTFTFARFIAAEAEAVARGGILRFADSPLSIDLRDARPWRSRLTGHAIHLGERTTRRSWKVAMRALKLDGRGATLLQLAGASIDMLVNASRDCDIARAGEALARLVGLGEGTTPAGDDYIVGHFTALWSCGGGNGARAKFVDRLGIQLKELAVRTRPLSRVYLEAAAEGEVSERLTNLAAQIAAGAPSRAVITAFAAAVAVGHSSGANGILGLLLGSAACGPGEIAPVSSVIPREAVKHA